VPKPRAWIAAERQQAAADGVAALATRHYGSVGGQQSRDMPRTTVDPLQLVFLCLRLPVTLAVKAQLLTMAGVIAADPELAPKVRVSDMHACFHVHFLLFSQP